MQQFPVKPVLAAVVAAATTGFLLGLLNAYAHKHGGVAMSGDEITLYSTLIGGFAFFISHQMRGNRSSARASGAEEARAKMFVAEPGSATTYIFRDAFFAKLVGFDVQLDGTSLGQTRGKTFFMLALAPGEHVLTSTNPQDGSQMQFSWNAVAGQIQYIEHALRFGAKGPNHGFAIVEQVQAQRRINRCKLLSVPCAETAAANATGA